MFILKKTPQLILDPTKALALVGVVEYAIGDGIKENKIGHKTGNGTRNTIWDIMYTGFIDTLTPIGYVSAITVRSKLWELVSFFDPETGLLYHAQREARHKELQRSWSKGRERSNYAYCSTFWFNHGLPAQMPQLSLSDCSFNDYDTTLTTSELEKISKTANQILSDLKIDENSVKGHVFILFESVTHMLKTIRAVIYNEKMQLVSEKSLNEYITAPESVIVDSASDYSDAANNPGHGLEFTADALKRKGRQLEASLSDSCDEDDIS